MLAAFDEFRNAVSVALEDALGVTFSDSEAMVLSHAVVGILSARHTPFLTEKKPGSIISQNATHTSIQSQTAINPSSPTPLPRGNVASREESDGCCSSQQRVDLLDLDGPSILPNVLTYLPFEDLNTLAVCCRRLRVLRADPALDQTRTGVVNFRSDFPGNGWNRLVHLIMSRNLGQIFQRNRTNLRLQGFVKTLNDATVDGLPGDFELNLPEVMSVQLTNEQGHENPYIQIGDTFSYLGSVLPNVEKLDISHSGNFSHFGNFSTIFPKLRVLTANHCEMRILRDGDMLRKWISLKELYVEGYNLGMSRPTSLQFGLPPSLERLDIMHLTDLFHQAFPTKDLLGIIRNNESIRWLRCDVSEEDLLLLKEASPDVTIVNF